MLSLRKKRAFIIITVFLVIIVNLLIAEVVIRIYHHTCDRQRFIWIPDNYLGYVHTPHNRFLHHYTEQERFSIAHKTNSFGLLSEEISLEKPADTFRIIVMGDSYTEALQVSDDKNYCRQLQDLLNSRGMPTNKKVEVLNAGVSGYSPLMHYLYFQRELAHLKPDMVIVQLFANDVYEDNETRARSIMSEEGLPLKISRYFLEKHYNKVVRADTFDANSPAYRLTKFFINKSRFFEYMYVKIINVRKQSAFHQKMVRTRDFTNGYQFFILNPEHMLTQDEAFRARTWGNTQHYLLALKGLVEDSQAQFMIFYIPMEMQLKLDKYGRHGLLYVSGFRGSYFNNMIKEFTQKNDIAFLDLLPSFKSNKMLGLYLDGDGHLTESAHAIAAGTLFSYLADNAMVP